MPSAWMCLLSAQSPTPELTFLTSTDRAAEHAAQERCCERGEVPGAME
jgi:hypothetical protein